MQLLDEFSYSNCLNSLKGQGKIKFKQTSFAIFRASNRLGGKEGYEC
jgi:hypothetical protein